MSPQRRSIGIGLGVVLVVFVALTIVLALPRQDGQPDVPRSSAAVPPDPSRATDASPIEIDNPIREIAGEPKNHPSGATPEMDLPPEEPAEEEVVEEIDADDVYADLLAKFEGRSLAYSGAKRAMPPDPIETGNATLTLRLLDAATLRPIRSDVQLWRIRAPESETWSAGDQQQYRVGVSRDGHRFHALASGHYRVFAHAARRGAVSPPAFDVTSPGRNVDVRVAMPRRFHIHVAIHDLDGTRIERASVRCWDSGESHGREPRPSWTKHRTQKIFRDGGITISETIGTSDASLPPKAEWVAAEQNGFRLGPIRENSRAESRFYLIDLDTSPLQGPSSLRLAPDFEKQKFVTVAIDPAIVLHSLRLANGGDASLARDQVTIEPQLLPFRTGDLESDRWRDVPVVVRARIENHEPIEFEFTPRGLPLIPRQLKSVR